MKFKEKNNLFDKYERLLKPITLQCEWCKQEKKQDELYDLSEIGYFYVDHVCKDCLESRTDEVDI